MQAALEQGQWPLVAADRRRARCSRWSTSGGSSRSPTSASRPPALAARREAPATLLVPAYVLVAATIWFGLFTSRHRRLRRRRGGHAAGRAAVSDADAMLVAVALPAAGAVGIALAGRWPNLREAVTLATAALLFLLVRRWCPRCSPAPARGSRCSSRSPASRSPSRSSRWACCSRWSPPGCGSSTRSTRSATCAATTRRTRPASTSASRSRSRRRWASPSPPTCSRCSCSTSC